LHYRLCPSATPGALLQARTQFQALKQQREAQLALYAGLGLVTVASATGGALLSTSAFPVFYALGYGGLKGYAMSLVLISFGCVVGESLWHPPLRKANERGSARHSYAALPSKATAFSSACSHAFLRTFLTALHHVCGPQCVTLLSYVIVIQVACWQLQQLTPSAAEEALQQVA
jgi:hypothetical protein